MVVAGVMRLRAVEHDQRIAVLEAWRHLARIEMAGIVTVAHAVQPVGEAGRAVVGSVLEKVDMHDGPMVNERVGSGKRRGGW